jgi:ATP-binding cassette subfamily B protein
MAEPSTKPSGHPDRNRPGAVSLLKQYRSLLPYITRYRGRYICGLVVLVIVDAAQIAIPQFIRQAIDLISSGVFQWKEIIFLCIWMTLIMALISAGRFFWRYFIHGSSRRIETEMREKIFEHLQTLSWDFYQKNKIGDLMARSTNDLNAVRMAIGMGLVAFVDFVVMATSILIIIFVQDAGSALFSIIPLPFITVLILIFRKYVGKRFQRAHETYSKMSDTVQESFAGMRVIKSFVKEWWFVGKFAADNDDYRKANMELVRLFGFFFPLVSFLSMLTVLLMMIIGGIKVVNGLMSPGSLVAMFRYLTMLIWPLIGAGFMVNMIQRGAVCLGRINEILNTVPSIRDEVAQPPIPSPQSPVPDIKIKNLSFSYGVEDEGQQKSDLALENINFTVGKGEWLGIMGKTGSGKSTLIKTLTRMIDPPHNTVFVCGQDVRTWPLATLRGLFGVSPQDSYLFSDSIKNNVAYGLDSDSDVPLLQKAVSMAALERDIVNFANGDLTLIGERGLTLSGGQKQRVAIARSLVMDSEILILDDSLSAVDAETERKILDALITERKGRTTIIISHRVSTLRYANKVLVLDHGKQSEYGSPDELVRSGGFYSRMATLQQLEEVAHG